MFVWFWLRALGLATLLCLLVPRPGLPEGEDDWRLGLAALERFGRSDEFADFKMTRCDDAGLHTLFPACRCYDLNATYKPGHPAAQGAESTSRRFVLRPKDARAYSTDDDADWIALALAEGLILNDEAAVKRFVTRGAGRFFAGGFVRRDGQRSYRVVSGFCGLPRVSIQAVDVDEQGRFVALRLIGKPTFDEDPKTHGELLEAIHKESKEDK